MGLKEWFFKPAEDIVRDIKNIGPEGVDIKNFKPIDLPEKEKIAEEVKSGMFRPSNFDEYIGQIKAKDLLKQYISFANERGDALPHTLLVAQAGYGKTTLARIIANELGVPFKEMITSEIEDFYEVLNTIEEQNGGIIFLDEIHSLVRDTAEQFYTLMEDFVHDGEKVPQFTLIGATTEIGELQETRKPFVDRFLLPVVLEDYTNLNLVTIGKQYNIKMYPNDILTDKVMHIISDNSRGTPRTIVRLIEATIRFKGNIKSVLNNFSIIKDGYTQNDLYTLNYIAQNDKGVGLQGLSSYLGTSKSNYLYSIEPYLLKNGLILRTPRGRKITSKGIKMVKELGNEKT